MRIIQNTTRVLTLAVIFLYTSTTRPQSYDRETKTSVSTRSYEEVVTTTQPRYSEQTTTTGVRATLFQEADAALQLAKEANAALLAPTAYELGLAHYQQAESKFKEGGKLEDIRAHLQQATQFFKQARSSAQWTKSAYEPALTAREDARRAQAPIHAAQSWQEAEVKMKKAARTLEDGNLKSGLKQIPEIEKQYRKAESTALQNHPQPNMRTMTNSLEEQRENIAELKQEIELRDARVHSLEQQVAALERKMGGKNGTASNHTATNGHTVAPRIAADPSLQSYFSKNEALVFRKDSDIVIRLYDLDFFANTGQLSSASAGSLWRVGEILRKHPYANVIVAGHVFSERDQATNLKLSRERAEAVKRYLIQNRLANQSIVAIGFGDTAPIPQDEMIEGPISNQRIDVIVEFGPSQMSYLYRY